MKKIGIIGCGWLGRKIATNFNDRGYEIFATNTSEETQQTMEDYGFNAHLLNFSGIEFMDFESEFTELKTIFDQCEVIIISVPVTNKEGIDYLTIKFKNIINFINSNIARQLFFFNSTSIYPNVNTVIDEDFSDSEVLNQNFYSIEQLLLESFPNINILRLAGLFGDDRIFGKYFANQLLETGLQPVNHIHYIDIIEIIYLMIKENVKQKLYNLVAPKHPTKKEIIKAQVAKYNIEPPSAILDDIQDYKIVSSNKLIKELSYRFLLPNPYDF